MIDVFTILSRANPGRWMGAININNNGDHIGRIDANNLYNAGAVRPVDFLIYYGWKQRDFLFK